MKPSVEFSSVFQEKKLALLDSANPNWHDEAETSKKWFNKVRKDPISRSRLANIHSSRAFTRFPAVAETLFNRNE